VLRSFANPRELWLYRRNALVDAAINNCFVVQYATVSSGSLLGISKIHRNVQRGIDRVVEPAEVPSCATGSRPRFVWLLYSRFRMFYNMCTIKRGAVQINTNQITCIYIVMRKFKGREVFIALHHDREHDIA
jgi:hypothetical protein